MNRLYSRKFLVLTFLCSFAIGVSAQSPAVDLPRKLTAEDYARAEKMLGFNTAPLVDRAGARPTFLPDGKFWYRVLTPTASEFVLINPADGSRKVDADAAKLGISITPPNAQNRNLSNFR
jgi:hypothetical protein